MKRTWVGALKVGQPVTFAQGEEMYFGTVKSVKRVQYKPNELKLVIKCASGLMRRFFFNRHHGWVYVTGRK